MSEVGDGVFAFTHQTFLEYFFARHLEDKYDTVPNLLKALRSRMSKSEWNEVTHLALQIKTYRSLSKQEEALTTLLGFVKAARSSRHQQAILSFSARALEYLSPAEAKLGEFFSVIEPLVFDSPMSAGRSHLPFLGIVSNAARGRREFVQDRVRAILAKRLLAEDGGQAFETISSYIGDGAHAGHEAAGEGSSLFLPRGVQAALLEQLRPVVIQRAEKSVNYRTLAWRWYGFLPAILSERDAFLIVFNNPFVGSFNGFDGFDGFTGLAIRVGAIGLNPNGHFALTKEAARTYLSRFGAANADFLPLRISEAKGRFGFSFVPVDFWKRTLDANDDVAVGIGIALAAALNAAQAKAARTDSNGQRAQENTRACILTWLGKPLIQKHNAAQILFKTITDGKLIEETQPGGRESTPTERR